VRKVELTMTEEFKYQTIKRQRNQFQKKQKQLHNSIVTLEDAHPRRPRARYFGELIQLDASVYIWFGNIEAYLHLAVDDCTDSIVGAFFAPQETLSGYYNVLYRILINHGIPACFLTDRRKVFEYKHKGTTELEKDTFTQFGYACKQLVV